MSMRMFIPAHKYTYQSNSMILPNTAIRLYDIDAIILLTCEIFARKLLSF